MNDELVSGCSIIAYEEAEDVALVNGDLERVPGTYRAAVTIRLPNGETVKANLSRGDYEKVIETFSFPAASEA